MDISNNLDTLGLLGSYDWQGKLDMGDCAALEGRLFYLVHNSGAFEYVLNWLEVEPGIYRRHPEQWNEVKDFSRDQTIPLACALGEYPEQRERLLHLYTLTMMRGKFQNGDFISPEHENVFRRGLGHKIRPLGDWLLLGFMIFFVTRSWLQWSWVDQDPNYSIVLDLATRKQPTRMSRLAAWIYKFRFRGPRWAIATYFKSNPPLEPHYEGIIK